MLQVDNSQLNTPPQNEPTVTPNVVHVREIQLGDTSFSHSLRTGLTDLQSVERGFNEFIQREAARDKVATIFNAFALPAVSFPAHLIDGSVIAHTDPWERGKLTSFLSNGGDSAAYRSALDKVLGETFKDGAVSSAEAKAFFRGLTSGRASLDENVRKVVQSSTDSALSVAISESYVRSVLQALATGIEDAAVRAKYLNDTVTDKELTEVLQYVSKTERQEFIRTLYTLSGVDSEVDEFIRGKLDNALFYPKISEKMELMREFYQRAEDPRAIKFMQALCRSSTYYSNLSGMVHFVGAENLAALGDPELTEYVAIYEMREKFEDIKWPTKVTATMGDAMTKFNVQQLEKRLQEILDFANSNEKLLGTDIVNVYRKSCDDNLKRLLLVQVTDPTNIAELKKVASFVMEKAKVELTYGVLLTEEGWNPAQYHFDARWTEQDVKDIGVTLKQIGEAQILLTPLLTELERVSYLGQYVLAARYGDGVVRVASLTINQPVVSQMYDGVSSLQAVLTHELGHAVQLGLDAGAFSDEGTDQVRFSDGDPIYEFKDWMAIAGWSVVPSDRVQVTPEGTSVCVDDVEYPLDKPTMFEGKMVVLSIYWDHLIKHDADAEFSSYEYCQSSPWEDFAEAFAEYYLTPERLIQLAPHKYQFLEQEFHRHQFRKDLQEKLERRLAEVEKSQVQ